MKYGYAVRTDMGFPILIRFANGAVETFSPNDSGEWRRSPAKDSILSGGGDFVWYDDVSEAEANKYMDEIRESARKAGNK